MISQAKILIVDDTPASLEVLEDLLLPLGYQLLFATNGHDALDLAQQHMPDLVLLDVMMPGISGYDVCRQIRSQSDLAEIPIILITALSDHASRIKGIEAGADDFITKPFNRQELRVRIRNITRLNRYRRLIAERQKFEYVITHAATGYLIINQQDEILFANLQAKRYLKLLIDEDTQLEGNFLREMFAKIYRLYPLSAWENWPHSVDLPRYLVRPETEALRGQWLQTDIMPFESDQEPKWIVTLNDVTQQVADRLDMRTFHTVIQHKLRTPLIGLISGLDLLDKWRSDLTSEQAAELIHIAYESTRRLNEQIEDVLQYIRTPLLLTDEEDFSLDQLSLLVEQVATSLNVQVLYSVESSNVLDYAVKLSIKVLETILYELFDNARKFHPDNKPEIEVSLKYHDGDVRLIVSDNGRYIPADLLETVWVPYYQIEKSFTGEVPGMGLGLSTVASLTWQVNGQCRIYNRPDQPGVTVEIRLPAAKQNHSNSEPITRRQ